MSSAPSSVPPPPFRVAPELPEGIVPRPRPAADPPPWRPWTAWVALVAGFAAALVAALLVGIVALAGGADYSNPTAAVNIVDTIVQDVCLVAAAILFAGLARRPHPTDFGLRPTRVLPALGWMALAFVAFYLVTVIWVQIVGGNTDDKKLVTDLGVDRSTIAMLSVAFLVAVVAPIAEEFFFRGFFFGALRNWRGVWPAAIITGLVFGAIHVSSSSATFLVPLAFFGFLLCVLRARTGSLYPGIVLHCANNSLAFGVSQDWGWEIGALFVAALAIIATLALVVRATWSPAVVA
jgi:membrane protease YdiL (CAAX protease family)